MSDIIKRVDELMSKVSGKADLTHKATAFAEEFFNIVEKYFPNISDIDVGKSKAIEYCEKYPLSDITKILDRQKADMESIKELQYKADNFLKVLDKKILNSKEYKSVPKFRNIVKQYVTMAKNIVKYTRGIRNIVEHSSSILEVQDSLSSILPDVEYLNEMSVSVRGVTISETLSYLLYAPLAWSKQKIVFNISQDWCRYIYSSLNEDFDLSVIANLPYNNFYTKIQVGDIFKLFYTEVDTVTKTLHIVGRIQANLDGKHRIADIVYIIPYNCKLKQSMGKTLYMQTGGTETLIARASDIISPFSTTPYVLYVPTEDPNFIRCVFPDAEKRRGDKNNIQTFWDNIVSVNYWGGVQQQRISLDDMYEVTTSRGLESNYAEFFSDGELPKTDTELLFYSQYALQVDNLELLTPYKDRLKSLCIDLDNPEDATKRISEMCDDDLLVREQELGIDVMLGALVYLASENTMKTIELQNKKYEKNEVKPETAKPNKPSKKSNKKVANATPVKLFDIAVKETEYYIKAKSQGIKNVYAKGSGKSKSKAPHIRKAHPHTFWVGKKDSEDRHTIVKFLLPTVIHKDSLEEQEINTITNITVNVDKQIKEMN